MAGEGTTGTAGAGAAAGNDDKGTAAGAEGAAAAAAAEKAAADAKAATDAKAGADKAAADAKAAAGADAAKKGGSSFAEAAAKKETDGKAKPEDAAKGADLDLKAPEGVEVDQKLLDGFKATAKEAGLTSASAQKVLDYYAGALKEAEKAQVTAAEQRQADQRKALEAHPKIGGANLEKSQELARRAVSTLDKLGDGLGSRAVKALAEAGLGDHPDVAHLLTVIGESMSEDSIGGRRGGETKVTTEEERLAKRYPSIKGLQRNG